MQWDRGARVGGPLSGGVVGGAARSEDCRPRQVEHLSKRRSVRADGCGMMQFNEERWWHAQGGLQRSWSRDVLFVRSWTAILVSSEVRVTDRAIGRPVQRGNWRRAT